MNNKLGYLEGDDLFRHIKDLLQAAMLDYHKGRGPRPRFLYLDEPYFLELWSHKASRNNWYFDGTVSSFLGLQVYTVSNIGSIPECYIHVA